MKTIRLEDLEYLMLHQVAKKHKVKPETYLKKLIDEEYAKIK